MDSVVLVIHLFLALAIVGLVLLQKSEGGALGGLGGGGGGFGGLVTASGADNLLTRATGLCAAGFFVTSLLLGILAGSASESKKASILDALPQTPPAIETPVESVPPPVPKPALPAVPVE